MNTTGRGTYWPIMGIATPDTVAKAPISVVYNDTVYYRTVNSTPQRVVYKSLDNKFLHVMP